jgi:hypothetical protein
MSESKITTEYDALDVWIAHMHWCQDVRNQGMKDLRKIWGNKDD